MVVQQMQRCITTLASLGSQSPLVNAILQMLLNCSPSDMYTVSFIPFFYYLLCLPPRHSFLIYSICYLSHSQRRSPTRSLRVSPVTLHLLYLTYSIRRDLCLLGINI
ncbi:hypothetical protein B0H10DRAFT_192374 [Mycena sp. CBHHK59/15]|nr:hypothetical protein B0H10DRAFT_192374 [Mycena sp. CBHHK59/15]